MGARRLIVPLGALLAAFAISACGADDFKNDPRPPAPIQLGARIGDDGVAISPGKGGDVGAGIANITISNQTSDPAKLVMEGPNDLASDPIVPEGTSSIKVDLKEGQYLVTNGGEGRQTKLEVAAERPSSQNDLLLP
jgi:hypothetical protein